MYVNHQKFRMAAQMAGKPKHFVGFPSSNLLLKIVELGIPGRAPQRLCPEVVCQLCCHLALVSSKIDALVAIGILHNYADSNLCAAPCSLSSSPTHCAGVCGCEHAVRGS